MNSRDGSSRPIPIDLEGLWVAASWIEPAAAHGFLATCEAPRPAQDVAAVAAALGVQLVFVPAAEAWAEECAAALQARDVAVGWAVPGPLGLVADSVGWVEVLRRSASDPALLAAPLADALRESSELARKGSRVGARVVVLADDLASDSGWLVSPDFALSSIVPCVSHVASEARRFGMPTLFHSDGDIRVIFGALREAGAAGVHVGALRQGALGAVLAAAQEAGLFAFGGIPARMLGSAGGGTVGLEDLAAELAELAADGGLIVCDDGGITTAAELSSLAATIAAIRNDVEG